jgi:hypothetical protein
VGQRKERIVGGSAQGEDHRWVSSRRGSQVGQLKERIIGGSAQGEYNRLVKSRRRS